MKNETDFILKYVGLTCDKVNTYMDSEYEKKMKKVASNFIRTEDARLITTKDSTTALSVCLQFFDVYRTAGPIKAILKSPKACEIRIPRSFEIGYFIYPYSDERDVREWLEHYGFSMKDILPSKPRKNYKNSRHQKYTKYIETRTEKIPPETRTDNHE